MGRLFALSRPQRAVTLWVLCAALPTARAAGRADSFPLPYRTVVLQLNFVPCDEMLRALRGDKKPFVPGSIKFARAQDDRLLVRYDDENQLRSFKEVIRLLDVPPAQIEVRAELVLATGRRGHETPSAALTLVGKTVSGRPILLSANDPGEFTAFGSARLVRAANTVHVVPTSVGDGGVNLVADWNLDVSVRMEGTPVPIRVTRRIASRIVSGGGAVQLGGARFSAPSRRSPDLTGQLTCCLSARVLPRPWIRQSNAVSARPYWDPYNTTLLVSRDRTDTHQEEALHQSIMTELTATKRYEVLLPESVSKAAAGIGIDTPRSLIEEDRLAAAANATTIVTAELSRISDRLTLAVRERDLSGLVRRADVPVADGSASALRASAYSAVRSLISYRGVGATVVHVAGDVKGAALVDCGAGDGVRKDTELSVMREGKQIGLLRVLRVYPRYCLARIEEGIGVVACEDEVIGYVRGQAVRVAPPDIRP